MSIYMPKNIKNLHILAIREKNQEIIRVWRNVARQIKMFHVKQNVKLKNSIENQ